MKDPIAIDTDDLIRTMEGPHIDCPACSGTHLLTYYLFSGCPNFEDPTRPVLIIPEGDR